MNSKCQVFGLHFLLLSSSVGYISSPSFYAVALSSEHFFAFFFFSCRSTQIKTYSWDNAQVILVGNKCDMEDERVISTERGQHLGEQLGKKQMIKLMRKRAW